MSTVFLASRHKRHHSWPPFPLHASKSTSRIDENPFAFFISTSDDVDGLADEHITADIELEPRSRSLSPFHLHRWTVEKSAEPGSDRTGFTKLKRWIAKMEKRYFHRRMISPPPVLVVSPVRVPQNSPNSPNSPNARGRNGLRGSPRGRASGTIRSHSRKPRVWREPGEDMWPLEEEQEDLGLGISVSNEERQPATSAHLSPWA